MKLIKIEHNTDYSEIVVERNFFSIKWEETYRKYGGELFEVKTNNIHSIDLGFMEHFTINSFFAIKKN